LTITRRELITGVLGGGAATGLVHFSGLRNLVKMAEASRATAPARGPFVLCTLYGGNDGLNTVVPYESGLYRDWRGSLAIPGDQVLPLGDDGQGNLGLHPSMTGTYALWKAGKVAVISGVEYPKPNLSHFASQTIWQTAQLSGDPGSGWLGRWLDLTGRDPFRAISVGPTLPVALVGDRQRASSVVDSTSAGAQLPLQNGAFEAAYKQMMSTYAGEPALEEAQAGAGADMLAVGARAASALGKEKAPPAAPGGNGGDIGTQLDIVAELIEYGMPTSVYSVSWASFDTHANQAETHAGLLASLDQAVQSFMSAFPKASPGKSPVLMIYSEFGRTPRANASGGTDHSTASVVLVVGPGVKGGFYGATPSFTRLDPYGNFMFTTDFRRIYATILEGVLGVETPRSVLGADFGPLGFL
jgi:uncharacterized protein (DUF1501 family)